MRIVMDSMFMMD